MNWVGWLNSLNFSPKHRMLEFYPSFFFLGIRIEKMSQDHREMDVRLPLRWYLRNLHGSMFGGAICAVCDPLAAVLCEYLLDAQGTRVHVWSKSQTVDFLRPGRTSILFRVRVSDEDLSSIQEQLDGKGQATRQFEFFGYGEQEEKVVRILNTVFLKKKD